MLMKLLKYDLKWMYKFLSIFYLLSLIFAGISRLFLKLNDSYIIHLIGKISLFITLVLIIVTIINNILACFVRFIRNVYKDESYLTHTLPVSEKSIFLSKVLSGIITILTSFLVLFICLFILEGSNFTGIFDDVDTSIIVKSCFILLLEMIFIVLIGYQSIIIGHRKNNNKIVSSVIIGLISYFIVQGLTILLMFIYGSFDSNIMAIFTSNNTSFSVLEKILNFGIILYFLYNVMLYIMSKKIYLKGINID
ncbi:MAG: hypothetical protein Q4C29_01320 [bacterium]|nr:hypothetical protein [bacterium]